MTPSPPENAPLRDCRLLIVEDDFLIADDLSRRFAALGAQVIGPAATLDAAHTIYGQAAQVDAAMLDINLRGTLIFPFAKRLEEDGVPFLFCTGYGEDPNSECFHHVARFEKPLTQQDFATMIDLIGRLARKARTGRAD